MKEEEVVEEVEDDTDLINGQILSDIYSDYLYDE